MGVGESRRARGTASTFEVVPLVFQSSQPRTAGITGYRAFALVTAFFFGVIAKRLGVAPIVAFLLAGVVIGPFTLPSLMSYRRQV